MGETRKRRIISQYTQDIQKTINVGFKQTLIIFGCDIKIRKVVQGNMMVMILVILLAIMTIRCIAHKISTLAMLLYIQDYGEVPNKDEIKRYTEKAAKKMFHIQNY